MHRILLEFVCKLVNSRDGFATDAQNIIGICMQAREGVKELLKDNPELANEIEKKIKLKLALNQPVAPVPAAKS